MFASTLGRIFFGVATAGLVYWFIKTVVAPALSGFSTQITGLVNQLAGMQTVSAFAAFLDLGWCISVILATFASCMAIKLASIAVRAFGVKT